MGFQTGSSGTRLGSRIEWEQLTNGRGGGGGMTTTPPPPPPPHVKNVIAKKVEKVIVFWERM